MRDDDPARASLDRATAYVDRGAILAGRAADAHNAGDDIQGELFAREVESMARDFDTFADDDRAFILWTAFVRTGRRAKDANGSQQRRIMMRRGPDEHPS